MTQELMDWLSQRCPEHHLAVKDGVIYLPNHTCEHKLDDLFDKFDITWGTENYRSTLYQFDKQMWISASMELVLKHNCYNEIKRLVGCATFKADDFKPNTHLDATAKSLCLVNAVMDLGDQFGRFLSVQTRPQEAKTKQKPDTIIVSKYVLAMKNSDWKTITEIDEYYDMSDYITKTTIPANA